MTDKHKNPGQSRRRFLNLSFLFGLGIFSSSKAQARAKALKSKSGEKIRLITANGQVVEVDKSHMPNFDQAKPVSDTELRRWKETNKE